MTRERTVFARRAGNQIHQAEESADRDGDARGLKHDETDHRFFECTLSRDLSSNGVDTLAIHRFYRDASHPRGLLTRLAILLHPFLSFHFVQIPVRRTQTSTPSGTILTAHEAIRLNFNRDPWSSIPNESITPVLPFSSLTDPEIFLPATFVHFVEIFTNGILYFSPVAASLPFFLSAASSLFTQTNLRAAQPTQSDATLRNATRDGDPESLLGYSSSSSFRSSAIVLYCSPCITYYFLL